MWVGGEVAERVQGVQVWRQDLPGGSGGGGGTGWWWWWWCWWHGAVVVARGGGGGTANVTCEPEDERLLVLAFHEFIEFTLQLDALIQRGKLPN